MIITTRRQERWSLQQSLWLDNVTSVDQASVVRLVGQASVCQIRSRPTGSAEAGPMSEVSSRSNVTPPTQGRVEVVGYVLEEERTQ